MQIPAPIKTFAKFIQSKLPFAIGKNEIYDRLTKKVIFKHCNASSVCIDIGSNQGKILQWMIQVAPTVQHVAFEPIPTLYQNLEKNYGNHAKIYPIALSDFATKRKFNFVETDPALSGFLKRPYPTHYQEKEMEVDCNLLDAIIDPSIKVSLIKMDVEGAEWEVLKGAIQTILRSKPLILFECGKIGGDLYGFSSKDIYQFFELEIHYQIFTLADWLKDKKSLSYQGFDQFYQTGQEYFFLALPIDNTI